MKSPHSPTFRFSIMVLALSSGFAHADNVRPEATAELKEVVVTGTAVPTRVTRNQLDRETSTDLKQVMKDQIGMDVGGGNGVAQFYSIRGVGEDKINLEVDGTSQSTKIFHHQSRFQLDPALVKSINVEKGTGAASAGLGAVGGTIRVTTVDAKDLLTDGKPFGFKLGAGLSSNKGSTGNAAVYGYQNGFDALFAGNFLNNRDYKDGNGNVNRGSRLKQHSYLAKLGYDFNDDHGIRLTYRQEYQKGNRTDKAEFQNVDSYVGVDGTYQKEQSYNLEYRGRNVGFLDKIDANVFQINTDDTKPPKGAPSPKAHASGTAQGGVPIGQLELSKIKATGANLNLASSFGDGHMVKYGVNYRHETSEPSDKGAWLKILGLYDRDKEKKSEYGVYAEGIWNLHPVTLTTGLRYDHFKYNAASKQSASHGQLNPSIGAIWDINDNFSLLANLNQASRAPRLNEALLANERAGAAADLDSNLKAETARRAELGFKWRNDNFNVSGSVFHQRIKDLIVYRWAKINNNTASITERGKIYNGGTLKTYGYELDASYRWGGLTARAGVSYVKPRLNGEMYYGESPIQEEDHESSFTFWNTGRQWLTGLSYQFENPKLEIGWRGRYAQSVKYTDVARGQGTIHGKKSGYGVHDIYANWQPLKKDNLNVNFAVNNIGNKQYRSHSQRFPDGNGRTPFYERGREFALGVNYRF